jgi:lipid-A-disaccharide synthase
MTNQEIQKEPMNIFICAGDLSGDERAADLVKELRRKEPSVRICAIGGNHLKENSDTFLEDIVDINAFGFLPFKHLRYLKGVLGKIKKQFELCKPKKVVLVDYYGFNIHVAVLAKSMNIPVYYFVSPQVWASRKGRIYKLKKLIKKMIVIFPFEEQIYRSKGVDAVFVGNPLIDKVPKKNALTAASPPLIGLFPGSREDTIKRHLPVLLETAEILRKKLNAEFVMFSHKKDLGTLLPSYIKLETADDMELRKKVDIAICPSGTSSLENALMGIPTAVMYKLSYINYIIIRLLIKVKFISIANILADRGIVPEFIQWRAKADKIAAFVEKELEPATYQRTVKDLSSIRKILGAGGANGRAAKIILND